jgi:nucleotide-binding universal stress UspA family protein
MSELKRILVPVDFSEYSQQALETAAELAGRLDAELHLLHVLEPWPPASSVTSEAYPLYHEYVAEANRRAEKALAELPIPGGPAKEVRRLTRSGHIQQEILQYAEEEKVDLIVVGTHGRTGIAHWFMGSVAEKIVRYAPCSVLVARHPKAAE